jgi:uncharacterized protein YecE (DUF72 family)
VRFFYRKIMNGTKRSSGHLYIGTSGWVYPHWREVFYPTAVPQRLWLPYYAQFFDATEINASFYRLPSVKAVQNWINDTPEQFMFCPKISRFITHAKKLNDPETCVPRFFDVFDPFDARMGPVLIQLPAALTFHEEKASIFFAFITNRYPNFSFSLEARHASWAQPGAVALLKRFGIGWVIADSGSRFASAELVTAKHIYLRFHGPDGSYASPYAKTMLRVYAEKCIAWRSQGHTVWAFFNNDVHGYAIANAETLKDLTVHPAPDPTAHPAPDPKTQPAPNPNN